MSRFPSRVPEVCHDVSLLVEVVLRYMMVSRFTSGGCLEVYPGVKFTRGGSLGVYPGVKVNKWRLS